MTTDLRPDPSKLGAIPVPPFAILPDPGRVFARRAERLEHLAKESRLAPYLRFLAALARVQADLAAAPAAPPPEAQTARARESGMPPLDRTALATDPELSATLDALLDAAAAIAMPDPARLALEAVRAADDGTRAWLFGAVLAHDVPVEDAAVHLWAAAAVQTLAARRAAALDAGRLVPVRVGVCPCCGGLPATSLVLGTLRIEGARYAVCATCATLWNEVRVKCLACGSTKGIGFRSFSDESVIKAEVCDECGSWVKILYQNKDAALDPLADDVASLGLDARMRETEYRRAGFDPFLVGF
ncbi:formate dehydrogenase accessory protein FdhE [Amaricoccus sp.]|uniref:formate dehydrogenase accessory protein FdhE n=1 Tax=Amaricoccus sp. TaxID=1872485 RepID=UPI001B64F254|nr:formate dehydrogenase accessory protein FdhE [Amaricoccus sp.]MBP7001766.1 formate dehydrogenase accessory protein FdhE [Amaricoccus sp.]